MKVNYDVGADLHKQIVEQHKPGQYVVTSTEKVWSGTLEGCINQYLAKPLSNQPVYNILVGEEAGVGKTILESANIEEIAARADFPKG
jgi:uncharacterized lipoprotein YmbA